MSLSRVIIRPQRRHPSGEHEPVRARVLGFHHRSQPHGPRGRRPAPGHRARGRPWRSDRHPPAPQEAGPGAQRSRVDPRHGRGSCLGSNMPGRSRGGTCRSCTEGAARLRSARASDRGLFPEALHARPHSPARQSAEGGSPASIPTARGQGREWPWAEQFEAPWCDAISRPLLT